jgi:hypothetical protein
MDERTLFDGFHEALEVEPRPGAYERMRFAMTNHPVALKRRPVLRIRWSKMGLRVAAVLAAAVLAVALGAAILVAHHGPVGSVPAGPDPNVKAYQAMIKSGYDAVAAGDSLSCGAVDDPACTTTVTTMVAPLNKWVSDLKSFQTPARFAALDGMLRRHLTDSITYQNAMLAAQKSKNATSFSFAFEGQFYERAWLDPAVGVIDGSSPRVAGSYHDALALARQHIDACVNQAPGPADIPCEQLYHADVCASVGVQACANDAHAMAAQIQSFLIGLLQNPAPGTLAAKDRKIQADLAQIDTDIIAITDALLNGDSAKTASAQSFYAADVRLTGSDIGVVVVGSA